jgi:hypothetical protein
MNYQKKYLKYKNKYLFVKNQIGGLNAVAIDAISRSTPEKFVIDIQIYDTLPPELTIQHFDKSNKYVALVTFQNDNETYVIDWNIKVNIDLSLNVEPGSEEDIKIKRFFDVEANYIKNNEEKIITSAIIKFKQTYPSFQPGKKWL